MDNEKKIRIFSTTKIAWLKMCSIKPVFIGVDDRGMVFFEYSDDQQVNVTLDDLKRQISSSAVIVNDYLKAYGETRQTMKSMTNMSNK